jgi:hypothetical protein
VYEFNDRAEGVSTWYVVQDLSNDLGERRLRLPTEAEGHRSPVLSAFEGPFVAFDYWGPRRELIRNRVSRHDVWWASELLAGLSDRQWKDAFAAGGYEPGTAGLLIEHLKTRIAIGRRIGSE